MLQLRKAKHGQHIVPEMQVSNTHKPTIERIADILAAHDIGHHIQTRFDRRAGCKTQYVVRVAGMKRVGKLLGLITEHLFTKREQAEVVQRFIARRMSVPQNTPYGTIEQGLYAAVRQANKIGTSEAICRAPNVISDEDMVRPNGKPLEAGGTRNDLPTPNLFGWEG